jgi:hypothetical protein
MLDKRESDTIQQVALNMDGLTTKNIFRALIACYRAGYRHAEDDYNEASLELNGSEGTWIERDRGTCEVRRAGPAAHAQPETPRNSPRAS